MRWVDPKDWRDPDRHRPCIVTLCTNDSTDRYPVPFCQEHVLYFWMLVEKDMREQGVTVEDVERRQREDLDRRIKEREDARPGTVYYLEVGDFLKIGYTRDLWRRMREYPPNAVLLAREEGTPDDERALHKRFAAYLESGREWFRDAPEIRAHIEEVRARSDQNGVQDLKRERRERKPRPRLRSKTSRNARNVL